MTRSRRPVKIAAPAIASAALIAAAWSAYRATDEGDGPPMPALKPCDLGRDAVVARSIGDLPAQVRTELARLFGKEGGLADANGPFNATDAVEDPTLPWRRFLRAYRVGETWLLWYEHGGVAYHLHALALTGAPDFRAAQGGNFIGDPCAGAKAFLAGARSVGDL